MAESEEELREKAILVEAYKIYKQRQEDKHNRDEESLTERRLARKLFPIPRQDIELDLKKDILQPIESEVNASLTQLRESLKRKLGLVLLLAETVETQEFHTVELGVLVGKYNSQLSRLLEIDDGFNALNTRLDKLIQLLTERVDANANIALEESVLVKLGAYLDKVNK